MTNFYPESTCPLPAIASNDLPSPNLKAAFCLLEESVSKLLFVQSVILNPYHSIQVKPFDEDELKYPVILSFSKDLFFGRTEEEILPPFSRQNDKAGQFVMDRRQMSP